MRCGDLERRARRNSAPAAPAPRRSRRRPARRSDSAVRAPRARRRSAPASGTSTQASSGKLRHRLPGEGHRMQRVAGRKAVAIQRRHRQRDAGVADERPLAHQRALEPACRSAGPTMPVTAMHDRRPHRRRAVEQRQQRRPARTRRCRRRAGWRAATASRTERRARAAVEAPAQPVLGDIEASHDELGTVHERSP